MSTVKQISEIIMHPDTDYEEATRFLNLIGNDGPFTFQTFSEINKNNKNLSRIDHGKIEDIYSSLVERNTKGAGIFVMINEGDGQGRKKENVRSVRSVFVDLDGAPLEPLTKSAIKPHIIIETSPRKYHGYWLVKDFPLDVFSSVQMKIAQTFNGDPAVKDLPRVMRIPGFNHNKGNPYKSRIISIEEHSRYSLDEILSAFPVDLTLSSNRLDTTKKIYEGGRNNFIFEMTNSFLSKGFPPEGVLEKILSANMRRCEPPLPESEIRDIWRRGCEHRPANNPLVAIVNDSKITQLRISTRWLYLIAKTREYGTSEPFSLTLKDCKEQGITQRQRKYGLEELIESGILLEVRPYQSGIKNKKRECSLYKFRLQNDT